MVSKMGLVKKISRLQAKLHVSNHPQSTPVRNLSNVSASSSMASFNQSFSSPPLSPVSSLGSNDVPSKNSTQSMDSDDNVSLSSASGCQDFSIPKLWRPTIMACITANSVEDQKKLLTLSIRNEIIRDLVTQMYAFSPKPDRAFCSKVAKELVKKHPFMKDSGTSVSGYVCLHRM
jgi:hypothetical protein